MFRWVLTPVALAWAKRTGSDSFSVSPANSCEASTLSDQDVFALVARAATSGATEVCFQVIRSLRYSQSTGQKPFGKLHAGEFECVQLKDQSETTQRALASLSDGDMVKLRRSSDWVVCAEERNGAHVKDVTLDRPVTINKVGRELSRTVMGTQEMTAKYQGSSKQDAAQLLVASDVTSGSEDLACFRIRTVEAYVLISSDTPVGELQKNQKFCLRLEDLSAEVQTMIGGLEIDGSVNVKLEHAKVEIEWRNIDGSTNNMIEWDIKATLSKRTKRAAEED